MRKWIWSILGILLAVGIFPVGVTEVGASSLSQAAKLMIEGTYEEPEVPATITNGRTFVPIRFVAEKMGTDVQWLKESSTIEIRQGANKIEMKLGSKQIKVNGTNFEMDVAPFVEQGRTLVPIRFVSEYLGLTVGWQSTQKLVIISKPIKLSLNGFVFSKPNEPIRVYDKIYVPIFELADQLHVDVKEIQNENKFSFTSKVGTSSQTDIKSVVEVKSINQNQGSVVTNDLPSTEIITIDDVRMVPYEWIDVLLGVTSEYNVNLKEINVTSSMNTFHGITLEDGLYTIDLDYIGSGSYNHFFLQSPHRLVVDFPFAVLGENLQGVETNVPVYQGTVDQIRIAQTSQTPQTVRVVFDLNNLSKVKFDIVDNKLKLKIEEKRPLIVIDAGHGGKDPGAVGKLTTESKVVLDISLKIIKLLEEDPNFDVIATRTDDSFPSLDDRVKLANDAEADLFLSVHANSVPNRPTVGGTETFVYQNSDRTFGSIVHKHLIAATNLSNRGLKEGNFKVLRETKMQAALIEIAFISNPEEEKLLMNSEFQDKVAKAMYDAIKEYYAGM